MSPTGVDEWLESGRDCLGRGGDLKEQVLDVNIMDLVLDDLFRIAAIISNDLEQVILKGWTKDLGHDTSMERGVIELGKALTSPGHEHGEGLVGHDLSHEASGRTGTLC